MKDWKTYAIVILSLWCIWLTNRRYHDRIVSREMAMCAARDVLGGWDRNRMIDATQTVFDKTFVDADDESAIWVEEGRLEKQRYEERRDKNSKSLKSSSHRANSPFRARRASGVVPQ